MKVSPLAPKAGFPALPEVKGARFATVASGVGYAGRDDVMLAHLVPGTSVAGVYTRSATCSAAVLDCREKTGGAQDKGAAILVNAGNANAFTGGAGRDAVKHLVEAVSKATDVPENRVYTASTGVIGEPLAAEGISTHLGTLTRELGMEGLGAAARAIMTTDTFPKGAGAQITIDGTEVAFAGIAKGSGMIAPDMATMLSFVFTDAAVDQDWLQAELARIADKSFNAITVDSDTSTSDTLIVAATGAAGVDATGNAAFSQALETLCLDLAHQVVRDGEGASKFVEIAVTGAATDADAKRVGLSVANSPLVKTAIAGEDANWGRIVMAVGKSGAQADRDLLSITFGDILVAEKGWVAASYNEDLGSAYMAREELVIGIDLGIGSGAARVWTCDLTHGYIEINADYRS
jgi:glutamate N-acetyltransferase/amino-acid N-acetyltransferase